MSSLNVTEPFTAGSGGFAYTIVPFGSVFQTGNGNQEAFLLGTFARFDLRATGLCQSGLAYANMTYTNGRPDNGCTNFGTATDVDRGRRTKMQLRCSTAVPPTTVASAVVVEAASTTPCLYVGTMFFDCTQHAAPYSDPNTLCVDLPTPSTTPTSTATASITPSSSATATASLAEGLTPSATNSITGSSR